MLAHYLALAASHRAPTPLPALSTLQINSNPGYCYLDSVGQHATLDVVFSVTNQDAAYELHVLESGTLLATLAVTATVYTFTTGGDVENAGLSQAPQTYNFTVQLVRKADGVVLQEQSKSYSGVWGTCR